MAPSLTTGKGELKMCSGFSTQAIVRLGGPVATLELRYETAATLLLRGVLQESNPTHRAILQRFPGGRSGGGAGLGQLFRAVAAWLQSRLRRDGLPADAVLLNPPHTSHAQGILPTDTAHKEDPGGEQEHDESAAGPANAAAGRGSGQGARKRRRQRDEEVVDLTKVGGWALPCDPASKASFCCHALNLLGGHLVLWSSTCGAAAVCRRACPSAWV